MKIGLTGGIATGKSAVLSYITERYGLPSFDADHVVHGLYKDTNVIDELTGHFGQGLLVNGEVSRSRVRDLFLQNPDAKKTLEDIFHPRVYSLYSQWIDCNLDEKLCIAEIPLLYENDSPYDFDWCIVVACSGKIQMNRLRNRSGLDRASATALISKQIPLSEKMNRADVVLWNEGVQDHLYRQVDALFCELLT